MDLERLKIDRSGAQRRRRGGSWLPRVVGGGAALLVLGAAWVFWRPAREAIDRVRLPEVRALRVERSHPAAVGAVRGMTANGYVVAARRAALSADAPGRIVELNVTEGSVVRRGDVVARLYDAEAKAALRRAEAERDLARASARSAQAALDAAEAARRRATSDVVAAGAATAAAKAERDLARADLARAEELGRAAVNTPRERDAAQSALDAAEARCRRAGALEAAARAAADAAEHRVAVARADLEVARARLAAAEAARAQAEAALDKMKVRAPFDGVVVLKDAEVGEVVSPNAQGGSNSRGSVATMVDFASLEVQADVPETSLRAVRPGGPARIYLDAFPDHPYRGRVDRIWPTADRQTATVEVRIAFLERDERLRPEMGVRVVFLPEEAGDAAAKTQAGKGSILVPEGAVVRSGGRDAVFVLERGVARLRPVTVGPRRSGRLEIRGGLSPGERIVLDPPPTLDDGARVRAREDGAP
ncbi:MAG: efflux RND transporter periplasmic adaptor subunit [Planctomycetota bacterium]|nr:MAG: efflux RND transporter periplasmic adaptor subunit [Planctomycetota bacterium]